MRVKGADGVVAKSSFWMMRKPVDLSRRMKFTHLNVITIISIQRPRKTLEDDQQLMSRPCPMFGVSS